MSAAPCHAAVRASTSGLAPSLTTTTMTVTSLRSREVHHGNVRCLELFSRCLFPDSIVEEPEVSREVKVPVARVVPNLAFSTPNFHTTSLPRSLPLFAGARLNSLDSFVGPDLGVGNPDPLAYLHHLHLRSIGTSQGVRVAHSLIPAATQGTTRSKGCGTSWPYSSSWALPSSALSPSHTQEVAMNIIALNRMKGLSVEYNWCLRLFCLSTACSLCRNPTGVLLDLTVKSCEVRK